MSKELIERLREAAAQRVASTAMIGADDLIAAADALESLGADRDSWERQAGDRLDDVLRVVAERDALANRVYQLEQKNSGAAEIIAAMQETHAEDQVELKALREQEPVAWGDEPWMASFGVRVGRDSSNSIDLIFTTVGQRKFQLYAHEAAYLRGLLNKAEIPGYPNTHPAPARELTDADIALCIASADKSFAQERISGKPVLGVWSKHLARAIERYLKGEGK